MTESLFPSSQVWTVSLPVTILNSPNVSDTASGGGHLAFGTAGVCRRELGLEFEQLADPLPRQDIIGVILFAFGFLLEAVADQQKYLFKSSKPPKGAIMTKGVWVSLPRFKSTAHRLTYLSLTALHATP